MTHTARALAEGFKVALPDAQKMCPHAVGAWALLSGIVFMRLVACGQVSWKERAQWRELAGIPSQAEVDRDNDHDPVKGRA